MNAFTEAEKQYKKLVQQTSATLPDAYCSVKNIELLDKKGLFQTLFFFFAPYYNPGSAAYFPETFFLQESGGIKIQKLSSPEIALNIQDKTVAEKTALLPQILKDILSYLPTLELSAKPNLDYLQKQLPIKELFLRHLEINRQLLLTGPPHANQHTIHREKAAAWVKAQKTPERQRLAQILLDHIRYISHNELLRALETCVQKAKRQLVEGPVIFVVGSPKKSNYYISLLFAHYWLQAGLPIDSVVHSLAQRKPEWLSGNFLDIDDMSYSGSQTEGILSRSFLSYIQSFRERVKAQLQDNPSYDRTHMFLPRHLVEKALHQQGFRYILVRAFMSEYSFDRLSNEVTTPKFPFQIATAETIRYLPGVSASDRKKIEYLFNDEVHTTVYFDHKVADIPSTFLLPISFGVVPERMLVKNIGVDMYDEEYVNDIEGEGVEFIPFIEFCDAEGREFPTNRETMLANDVANAYRCPPAWYKRINYNRGVIGGTRRQRRSKRKTRSTSK